MTPDPAGRAGGPDWLSRWATHGVAPGAALDRFDGLPEVAPEAILGRWRGAELPTGHPLDGLLGRLGWYGKLFRGPDDVQPLLFRRPSGEPMPVDPALMPVRVALRWPALARSAPARASFAALRPLLRARTPKARLRRIEFRGRSSAAMIYDRQPIIDHFRRVDDASLLGLMDLRGVAPFFFLLRREAEAGSG